MQFNKKSFFLFVALLSSYHINHATVSQSLFSTFWDWKIACTKCINAPRSNTPLSKKELLNEVNQFCNAHNSGPLAAKENWVHIGIDHNRPELNFFTETVFEPYVQKIEVMPGTQIAFHGDVHGDITSFNAFIEFLATQGYLDQHDPFKIIDPNFKIIMLGDYTDRGQWGAEVMYAVMRMKRLNPEQFFMVRGNHEDCPINNAYGFTAELQRKFNDSSMIQSVSRIYNYLPVALYVCSGAELHKDALLCCHGGLELGFAHTQKLLDAPGANRYVLVDILARKTRCSHLDNNYKPCVNHLPLSDIVLTSPAGDACPPLGFMWNDFDFNPCSDQTKKIEYISGRGFMFPEQITKYLLRYDSTKNCTICGIFRAHQHNAVTMPHILNKNGNHDAADTGVAKLWAPYGMELIAGALWDGIVCTFCVSPNNSFGQTFGYNFDAFGILTTAEKYKDWHLQIHRIFP